jgi:IS1 family transposase
MHFENSNKFISEVFGSATTLNTASALLPTLSMSQFNVVTGFHWAEYAEFVSCPYAKDMYNHPLLYAME